MAGIDPVIAGQIAEPLQRALHIGKAAAGEIGAAAGAIKQRVAGEQHILHLQRDGAGGVAGGAEHVHRQIAHVDRTALIVKLNRLHRPHLVAELAAVPGLWIVGLGDIDGQIGVDRQQIGHAQHMVKVAVGQQNELYVQVVLPDARQDLIGASAGIDHGGGVACRLVGEQIAVGADHADLQRI